MSTALFPVYLQQRPRTADLNPCRGPSPSLCGRQARHLLEAVA